MQKSAASKIFARLALIATVFVVGFAHAQQKAPADDPFAAFSGSLTSVPDAETLTNRGSFYVPAFSSIRVGGGRTRLDLAVTISIHNSSRTKVLTLNEVDYFDTSGTLVQRFLTRAIALRPFGTVEVFIPTDDVRGGTGANFVVAWATAGAIEEPIIEAVMVGTVGTAGYSFVSQGRAIHVLQETKKSPSPAQ